MFTPTVRMSVRLLPVIVAIHLTAGCGRPQTSQPAGGTAREWTGARPARTQAESKNYAEAVETCRRALAEKPEDPSLRDALAVAQAGLYLHRGELKEALDLLQELMARQPAAYKQVDAVLTEGAAGDALRQLVKLARGRSEQQPSDAAALYICGRLLALAGEFDAAVEELGAAATANEGWGAPQAALAKLFVAKKKWDEAIRAADAAIEAGCNDADVYLAKGRAHDALDEPDEAESAWLKAFAQDRKSAEPLCLLAESMERRGRRDRCEQIYRQILDDVDRRSTVAREKLFNLYLNTNRLQEAKECYGGFAKADLAGPAAERCRARLNFATSQLPDDNLRSTVYQDELRKIAADYPDDAVTRLAQAEGYFETKSYAQAAVCVDEALRLDPENLPARELKVLLERGLLRFSEATAAVESLLKDHPRDAAYQQKLLELAMIEADYDKAVTALHGLLARRDLTDDQRKAATAELIEALLGGGRSDEAVDAAKSWLSEAPDEASRRDAWLIALTRAGRNHQAIEAVSRWLADDPTNTDLRSRYAAQLQAAGRNIQAQQQVLSWLANDPDDMNLNGLLISLLWSAKQWDAAIEVAQTGAELPAHRGFYETLLGQSYVLARRYDEAIDFYRDRANTAPTDSAYTDLLSVLILAERFGEAEQLANKLLGVVAELARRGGTRQLDPELLVNLRRQLARIYELTGRREQASQQREAIYAMMPGDPGTCNDLGYSWADMGERIEDAERLIRFAVAKRPQEPNYLDSLGWVLYKGGHFKDAVYYLRLAIRKATEGDPIVLDHLGDALYRDHMIDAARDCWEKALEQTAPDHDPPPDAEHRHLHARLTLKLGQLTDGGDVETAPAAASTPASQAAEEKGRQKAATTGTIPAGNQNR